MAQDSQMNRLRERAILVAREFKAVFHGVPERFGKVMARWLWRWLFLAPDGKPHRAGRIVLRDLAQREVNELHVEAGHKLNGSLIREGLVDELLVYLAPRLLGAGRGLTNLGPWTALNEAINLEFRTVDKVGPDLRVLARIPGRDSF